MGGEVGLSTALDRGDLQLLADERVFRNGNAIGLYDCVHEKPALCRSIRIKKSAMILPARTLRIWCDRDTLETEPGDLAVDAGANIGYTASYS